MAFYVQEVCDGCRSRRDLYKLACAYCEECIFRLERNCVDVFHGRLMTKTLDPISILPVDVVPAVLAPETLPPISISPGKITPTELVTKTLSPISILPVDVIPAELVLTNLSPISISDIIPAELVPETLSPISIIPVDISPAKLVQKNLSTISILPAVSQVPKRIENPAPVIEEGKRDERKEATWSNLKGKNVAAGLKKSGVDPKRPSTPESTLDSELKPKAPPSNSLFYGKTQTRDLLWITKKVVYKRSVENDIVTEQKKICNMSSLSVNDSCSWAWLADDQIVVCGNIGAHIVSLSDGQSQKIKLREQRELPGIGVSPDSPRPYFFGGKLDNRVLNSFEDGERNSQAVMSERRFGFHPTYYDRRFFIAGGVTSHGVEEFSLLYRTFSMHVPTPMISECALVVVKDDTLFIIQSNKTHKILDLFNFTCITSQNTFEEVNTPTAPLVCGNKVFALDRGGEVLKVTIS